MKNDTYAPLYLDEFESPDKPGSGIEMNPEFMEMLLRARVEAGVPFIINSGFRTPAHNKKVGGKKNSSHLDGYAADIACGNSRHRGLILKALRKVGFTRIGIANTFIHVDDDPFKPVDVTWMY